MLISTEKSRAERDVIVAALPSRLGGAGTITL